MGLQKKHGKGRLDKWYKLAKEKGYRARAAFKLIQINQKYGFLQKSKVLLDLCAAPGSWCQVAAEAMPAESLIVGVDLAPIKPIPRVISFQSDITTEKCRATIRQHLKTWKADTVLHDGAPNVGTAWVQDAFTQAMLALQAMKLATEFLAEGGTFVTKIFRSKDYNSLLWVFNQLFTKVEATKPPASRDVSAEIFVICRGYKAPKHVDPRFVDPKTVFEELADPTPNNEAKVFKPETKKRKREGYEEGNLTQFKEVTASHFVQHTDPLEILGGANKITFAQSSNGDIAQAAIDALPETTEEIRQCCDDLRVLGRKEFRMLLKWRLKLRDRFGLSIKKKSLAEKADKTEVAEVESMDEEMKIQEDLQKLKEKETARKKRERRRLNERKTRDIVRMQLNMTAPMDIGVEQSGPRGEGAMFDLKVVDRSKNAAKNGDVVAPENPTQESDDDLSSDISSDSDEDGDNLDRELDFLYDSYKERRADVDAKFRAKQARKDHEHEDWEGFSGDELDSKASDAGMSEISSDEENGTSTSKRLITDLDNSQEGTNGLSKRAYKFFNQPLFKDIGGLDDEDSHSKEKSTSTEKAKISNGTNGILRKPKIQLEPNAESSSDSDEDEFEVVKAPREDGWEDEKEENSRKPLDIDIITAEAMTLAHQLATGEKSVHDFQDEGFNKYSFRDRDGLPEWFLDDEGKHSKPQKPISAAAAAAIKEKLRALNARPIKKVQEAKQRKKFKAAQKLEKLRKKSALLLEDEGMTEKEKAQGIARLMSRAAKKKPKKNVKLVVARGKNRGVAGRPRGVKGKYKIVDARLKKDVRADKRIAKKHQ